MLQTSKTEIIQKINTLMNENESVQAAMTAVADLQNQAEQATGSKRDDLLKQLQLAQASMKQTISENVVLKIYAELQGEFTDYINAAGFLASAWIKAYSESFHELNMHQMPALSCKNSIVAGMVKGA